MQSPKLNAEKITHPFQLMAAWFVMLIMLVGILLLGASRIWIPGLLAISAVVLPLVVMAAVFAMLTRFRPHLQDAKEYASWLKDERRYSNRIVEPLQIRELSDRTDDTATTIISTTSLRVSAPTVNVSMEVAPLPRADAVIDRLRTLGFRASRYVPPVEEEWAEFASVRNQKAIWVGSEVPSADAVLAIKNVAQIWPHLCFLHLSSDGGGPEYIHEQMFFGGSTRTALHYGLSKWTGAELQEIPDGISMADWHSAVRAKYGLDTLEEEQTTYDSVAGEN